MITAAQAREYMNPTIEEQIINAARRGECSVEVEDCTDIKAIELQGNGFLVLDTGVFKTKIQWAIPLEGGAK